jgi:small-conductance mechanosensitive channel
MDYLLSLNEEFWEQLAEASMEPATLGLTVPHLALALLAVALGFLLTMGVRRTQEFLMTRGTTRAGRLVAVLPVFSLVIWGATLGVALGIMLDPSGQWAVLVWGLGVLALLIGLRDVLRQTLSGAVLILEGRIRLGEHIRVAGFRGRVERVALDRVTLRSPDGAEHQLPPFDILNNPVTHEDAKGAHPLEIDFPVPESLDVQVAARLLYEVAALSPYADPRCRPEVSILAVDGDACLSLLARAATVEYERRYQTQIGVRFTREVARINAEAVSAS